MPKGTRTHLLQNVDVAARRAECVECGEVRIMNKGKDPRGRQRWACPTVRHNPQRARNSTLYRREQVRPHLQYRGNVCHRCGFQHDDVRVFDVHHKDGDHGNNDPGNLETLCPTCHRLHHCGL